MKKWIQALFAFLLQITLLQISSAQKPPLAKKFDLVCKTIDSNKTLNTIKFNNEEFMDQVTDEGGMLTIYYSGNNIYKITEWIGLSSEVMIHNFYFHQNKLILVKDEEWFYAYDDKNGINKKVLAKDNHFRGLYYFSNNKLIYQESLGHNRFEDDRNDAEAEFLSRVKEYINLFKKKKKL